MMKLLKSVFIMKLNNLSSEVKKEMNINGITYFEGDKLNNSLIKKMNKYNISYFDGVYTLNKKIKIKTKHGDFIIPKGFYWNGSSYSITTDTNLIASMVHDYLLKTYDGEHYKWIDEVYRELCLRHNMSRIRAFYLYRGLRSYAFYLNGFRMEKKVS